MSVQEYGQWMKVEQQLRELKKQKDLEQMRKFREMVTKPHRHHRTKTEENDAIDKSFSHETNLNDYPRTSTIGKLSIIMYFSTQIFSLFKLFWIIYLLHYISFSDMLEEEYTYSDDDEY